MALNLTPNEAARHGLNINQDGIRRTAFDLLGFPNVEMASLGRIWPELAAIAPKIAAQVEIDAKYAVYLERQAADIASFRRDEALRIPTCSTIGRSPACRPSCATSLSPSARRPWVRPAGSKASPRRR